MKLSSILGKTLVFRATAAVILMACGDLPASAGIDVPSAPRGTEAAAGRHLVHHVPGSLDITWQAATRRAGIVFRLYRWAGTTDFELIYELPALPGRADYLVGDAGLSTIQLYELRVAERGDAEGEEVTLGTLEVRIPGWQSKETMPSSRDLSPGGIRVITGFPATSPAPLPAAAPLLAACFSLEPPEPPPRIARGRSHPV